MLYEVWSRIRRQDWCIDRIRGEYTIEGGTILLPLQDGQYFMIEESVFNDCKIYKYPATDMIDETFRGDIVPMAIPQAFISLVDEMKSYEEWRSEKLKSGAYSSEGFGGYSYSMIMGSDGAPISAMALFSKRLVGFRKQ